MNKDRDGELEREIRTHLDLEAEERVADGMSETEARYAARRAFGNVTRTQEDVRDVWTRRWLDEIVQDVRYALRTLHKSPAFTTVAVLTIALGIGANTAMFSVVNAAILLPLGYPQPGQLRFLTTGSSGGGEGSLSPAEYWEFTEINQSFSVVGAFVTGEVNLSAGDRPLRAMRASVNAELLEALAVAPERGRWFRREETRAGGPSLVILSHDLWHSAFGAREDVAGQFERFNAMPGIVGVAAVSGLPPRRESNRFGTDIENYTPPPERSELVEYYQTVTSGYFETMRIPIVRGRGFEETDRTATPVAVVNEAFVRTFWKGIDPIGHRVRPRFGDQTPWVTVIGVAKDVKQAGVDRPTGTELYLLLDQLPRIFPGIPAARLGNVLGNGSMHVMLRTALPATRLQASILDAVHEADPSLPIIRLSDMEDVFRWSVRRSRMLMQLLTGFAGLALLLAAIGTYGVLSYMVTQHRREIGIRMALGAERSTVLRAVLGHGLKLTCVGLVAGLAAALALTRWMQTLLFEVRPNDPATLASVAALITAVAATASLIPAVRATRVDPIVALKDE
jgi:hypothetical protein